MKRAQDCDLSTIEHDGTPKLRKGKNLQSKGTQRQFNSNFNLVDGKYNSTTIKNESYGNFKIKKELVWKADECKSLASQIDSDQYKRAEYTSSFNPNESLSFLEESGSSNDAFPIPLNPLYDLQALVMVRTFD